MPKFHPHVSHYERGAIQAIDFLESDFTPDEYRGHLKACIIKYVSRYLYKGKPIEDLTKAQTYLLWLIEFEGNRPADELQGGKNHE